MVGEGAVDRFRELVETAEQVPAFHVRAILAEADLSTPAGRDRALDEALPVLGTMGETISRDELIRETADRLDADPGLVARRVGDARGPRAAEAEAAGAGARPGAGGGGQSAGAAGSAPSGDDARAATGGPATLGPRERRGWALLQLCIAEPKVGRGYVERLTPEHFSSPIAGRALEWLREHLEAPLSGLPRDDDELVSVVTRLVMRSEREPAPAEAMELNFLELEQGLIEDRIAAAESAGGDPPVELQRQRAELAERRAHFHSVEP
jgi:DNA primase